jgi:rRNA maturation RNase YbeY
MAGSTKKSPKKAPPPLHLDNLVVSASHHPDGARWSTQLGTLCETFLDALEIEGAEVSLSIVDDAEIQRLNKQWRKKNKPTDVLSFPAGEDPFDQPEFYEPLGDVILSLDTAKARAKAEKRALGVELARYLAHGLLHLLGHDHHQAKEARLMAAEERRLLGEAGMVGEAWSDLGDGAPVAAPAKPAQPAKRPATKASPAKKPAKAKPGRGTARPRAQSKKAPRSTRD